MSKKHDGGAPSSPAPLAEEDNTKYILVLGPQGSDKSTFVNAIPDGPPARKNTKQFVISPKFIVNNQTFAFIDSPELYNKAMDDEEILKGIVDHLHRKGTNEHAKLTGIIYIHPQVESLENRALWRNFHMLNELVGHTFRERVTIVVKLQSENNINTNEQAVPAPYLQPHAPFAHFHRGVKHKIWPFRELKWGAVQTVLRRYTFFQPLHIRAQSKILDGSWKSEELISQLKMWLPAPYVKECSCDQPPRRDEEKRPTTRPTTNTRDQDKLKEESERQEGKDPTNSMQDKDRPREGSERQEEKSPTQDQDKPKEESEYQEEKGPTQDKDKPKKDSEHQEDKEQLKERLRRVEEDYALLCSHLQVEDNVEEHRITAALQDVNHLIGEIGVLVSQHIHENASDSNYLESLGDISSLQELLGRFKHTEGKPSLVQSSRGAYMEPGDFFDYAVRTTLCQKLDEKLFKPFHPSVAEGSDSMIDVYNHIRNNEPQLVAGRWRRDTFNAMDRVSAMKPGESSTLRLHDILVNSLNDLLESCATPTFKEKIIEEERKSLVKLAEKAEELNRLVKGRVVYLGDFRPMMFSCGENFQDYCMSELQIDQSPKKSDHPEVILATVALGLVRQHALGRGQGPEEIVILKATVVTERVCMFSEL